MAGKKATGNRELFFNTQRILRWMRVYRGNKDLHPDLLAYEQQQAMLRKEQRKRYFLAKAIKLFS